MANARRLSKTESIYCRGIRQEQVRACPLLQIQVFGFSKQRSLATLAGRSSRLSAACRMHDRTSGHRPASVRHRARSNRLPPAQPRFLKCGWILSMRFLVGESKSCRLQRFFRIACQMYLFDADGWISLDPAGSGNRWSILLLFLVEILPLAGRQRLSRSLMPTETLDCPSAAGRPARSLVNRLLMPDGNERTAID